MDSIFCCLQQDMLTIGLGGQTDNEYRTQLLLWTVLGAPFVLSCDVANLTNAQLQLLTHPRLLSIARDEDCVQGSLVIDICFVFKFLVLLL
jgi:alpha-galactosidase